MMADINLVPREVFLQRRGRRLTWVAIAVVLLMLLVLATAYLVRMGSIADLEERRDQLAGQVTNRELLIAELQDVDALDQRRQAGNEVLAYAMVDEPDATAILVDLSEQMPVEAGVLDLTMQFEQFEDLTDLPEGEQEAIGTIQLQVVTTEYYSPGVRAVLSAMTATERYTGSYFGTASLRNPEDLPDVVDIDGFAWLTAETFTNRYEDGLPEAERPEGAPW